MNNDELIERFDRDVDRMLYIQRPEEPRVDSAEYHQVLALASALARADFSDESELRVELRARLLKTQAERRNPERAAQRQRREPTIGRQPVGRLATRGWLLALALLLLLSSLPTGWSGSLLAQELPSGSQSAQLAPTSSDRLIEVGGASQPRPQPRPTPQLAATDIRRVELGAGRTSSQTGRPDDTLIAGTPFAPGK